MFEIIMQYNPKEDYEVNIETINELISFVWEEFSLGHYNFLVLSKIEEPSYMQFFINEDADFILEVLLDEKVFRLVLDDMETLKSIFAGYFKGFNIDTSVFTDITDSIRKDVL